ncbi:hypothetical protein JCM17960_26170 [Magnetospira thiophila]
MHCHCNPSDRAQQEYLLKQAEADTEAVWKMPPDTPQHGTDQILRHVPVEDWSSTQALKVKTSPSSFQSGHPGNATARPKLDRRTPWPQNTGPGQGRTNRNTGHGRVTAIRCLI